MKAEDFRKGEIVLVEATNYDTTDRTKKPIMITKRIEGVVDVDKRGRRYITLPFFFSDGEDRFDGVDYVKLKNFKKDASVKGSTGMVRWKSSWLNCGFVVLGGLDFIRDEKLKKLGL
jgi:hypothetical protein